MGFLKYLHCGILNFSLLTSFKKDFLVLARLCLNQTSAVQDTIDKFRISVDSVAKIMDSCSSGYRIK